MNPDAIIAVRPHFWRNGDDLHFFLSNRVYRKLTSAEAAVWHKLQQGPQMAHELGNLGALKALADAKIVEVLEPIRERSRRSILVVEPHCDDAALSIGATMWKLRNQAEFHLLTMASRSNYTSNFQLHREYFSRSRITEMRAAEGELFIRHIGGTYTCAGFSEATLRYDDSDWNLGFFQRHEVSVASSNNRKSNRSVLDDWIAWLGEFIATRSFDEIWIPLGAGTHTDHDLTRNAALQTMMQLKPRATVRLYADVPYSCEYSEHTNRILCKLNEHGAKLSPWFQEVGEAFATKLSLLSIFASQFKVSAVQGEVERCAGDNPVEHLWTVDVLPRHLPAREMWIGAPEIAAAASSISYFLRESSTEHRVAIFAINASGRWASDLQLLEAQFPTARFIVYASSKVRAEFEAVAHPRTAVRGVNGRALSWLTAALRETATGHRIVIAGQAIEKARAMALLWPTGRKLILANMDQLSQHLEKLR